MDGLKQLRPQQATEWYYPNMMYRVMWCGTEKKMFPFFCVVFECGKTWVNWHNVPM